MNIKRKIRDSDTIPRGYGFSYYDYASRYVICYPIPINLIIQIWRSLRRILVMGFYTQDRILKINSEYWRGFDDGVKAKNDVSEDLLRRIMETQINSEGKEEEVKIGRDATLRAWEIHLPFEHFLSYIGFEISRRGVRLYIKDILLEKLDERRFGYDHRKHQ